MPFESGLKTAVTDVRSPILGEPWNGRGRERRRSDDGRGGVPCVWHRTFGERSVLPSRGSAVVESETPAEYKQVTVLFADAVHSMDIATAVGAER
jgi:class 3 adenylate cyclase